jgi:hypothetical protein
LFCVQIHTQPRGAPPPAPDKVPAACTSNKLFASSGGAAAPATSLDISETLTVQTDAAGAEEARVVLLAYSSEKQASVALGFAVVRLHALAIDAARAGGTRYMALKLLDSKGREVGTVKAAVNVTVAKAASLGAPAAGDAKGKTRPGGDAPKKAASPPQPPAPRLAKAAATTTTPPAPAATGGLRHDAIYHDVGSSGARLYAEQSSETDRFRMQVHGRASPMRPEDAPPGPEIYVPYTHTAAATGKEGSGDELAGAEQRQREREWAARLEEENARLRAMLTAVSKGLEEAVPDGVGSDGGSVSSRSSRSGSEKGLGRSTAFDVGEDFLNRFQEHKAAMDKKLGVLKARLANPTGDNALVSDNRRLEEQLEQTRRHAMASQVRLCAPRWGPPWHLSNEPSPSPTSRVHHRPSRPKRTVSGAQRAN